VFLSATTAERFFGALRHGCGLAADTVARQSETQDTISKEGKPMSKKIIMMAAALLGFATIGATSEAQAEKRTFTLAAVEMKGGATVDKESFPTDALPAGAGYVLKQPDQTGRWEVSVYMWTPGQIFVNQDDEVTLEFVGINGASHPTTIAGYDKSFVLKRGQVTKISFKADKAGTFAIQCGIHHPSMTAELVVLPRK
jgi:heme/copper-type cytochrome/quinol oxidase subunit 2